jgi:inner membrane protein
VESFLRCHLLASRRSHLSSIAGFGHVAVGLVSGRLHAESSGRRAWPSLLGFGVLAMLPDFDVLPVELGVPDAGIWGHRGVSHTPLFALLAGVVAAVLLWRKLPDAWRFGLAVAMAVGTHCLLDALAQDGRGMMFFWPLTAARYHFLWRPIPDAPRGLAYFTGIGLRHFAIELVYFFPFTLYALRPRWIRRQRPSRVATPAAPFVADG